MEIDFSTYPVRDAYALLTSSIMPRPVAWVSTVSQEGATNLAPFSFFQGVTASPPTLLIVPVNHRDGRKKDTVRNIEETGEFVVNVVPFALAEQMNATAALLENGESEFEKFGIAQAPSTRVRPPRVAASPIAFECTVHQIVAVGEGSLAAHVVLGRIRHAHVADGVLGQDGLPDPGKLDLVGRLGGELYARTTERFAIKRPDR
jgi:flavin reductase (DIM6/NTAB) family NADH-FMN oxidoreductase RutF